MTFLFIKAMVSAAIIVAVSEIAKRNSTLSALVVALPFVSVLSIVWLWAETGDRAKIAALSETTPWFILPSLPMFFLIPAMLRANYGFWITLGAGLLLTATLYLLMTAILARFGVNL
ncbi:peptide ABC transporter permease [Rhodomicrobium udaipurense JA643]|uniref:DUF3147 family protein n=1 Tax=Rhodomicrobium udaipurense TaxID=1202716 RepID=A0A8I1KHZ7_9HYPH|nr:DUF3147 family protein [Rhodomicrobium udaipurense]KAI93358.1 peptide ABC transporter permease [Rhodomicrobium udaipurense JA643]MBJ7542097.1 DUF3147 family protein [Rhodomicrobium udaipurense]